jgi:hypothetical protein
MSRDTGGGAGTHPQAIADRAEKLEGKVSCRKEIRRRFAA